MKQPNSGPGAAHTGLFGRHTIHRAPEGDGGGSAKPPTLEERIGTLAELLEKQLGATQATTPAPAPTATASAPTAAPQVDYQALAKAMIEAQAAQPKPAAAPAAPSAHTLPTAMGLVDLFAMQPHELHALGPQEVRKNLDQLWAIGRQASGAPQRPKPPGVK